MTRELPLWAQVPDYPARVDRTLITALWDEGVMSLADFRVTQRGIGADMSVDISAGQAVIQGDDQTDQGRYLATSTAVENMIVGAAPGAGSRYDIVVAEVRDSNALGAAGDDWQFRVIAGTAGTSPTVPVTPPSALRLAIIGPILTTTVAVVDAMIVDARQLAGERCAVGTVRAYDGIPSRLPNGWIPWAGQSVLRTAQPRLFIHYLVAGDGTTPKYGAADANHFYVGDGRGRTLIGLDDMSAGNGDAGIIDVALSVGTKIGAQYVQLSTAHLAQHQHSIPAHSHGALTGNASNDHYHHVKGTTGGNTNDHTHPLAGAGAGMSEHAGHNHGPGINSVAFAGVQNGGTYGYAVVGGSYYLTLDSITGPSGRHSHTLQGSTAGQSSGHAHHYESYTGGISATHNHGIAAEALLSNSTGSGTPHQNMQPSIGVMLIVRT